MPPEEKERIAVLEAKSLQTDSIVKTLSSKIDSLAAQSDRVERRLEKMQTQAQTAIWIVGVLWAVVKVVLPFVTGGKL